MANGHVCTCIVAMCTIIIVQLHVCVVLASVIVQYEHHMIILYISCDVICISDENGMAGYKSMNIFY